MPTNQKSSVVKSLALALMNEPQITASFVKRILRAAKVFGDLPAYLQEGYAAGIPNGGLCECSRCHKPLQDIAHPEVCDQKDEAIMVWPDTVLCKMCHRQMLQAKLQPLPPVA